MIDFLDMDLFDAPPGACLAHACNARGVWGAGVALGFARRFPEARKAYELWCRSFENAATGLAHVSQAGAFYVGSLITSADYGQNRDSAEMILWHTSLAIRDLHDLLPGDIDVYMPRINSGLFAVPWEDTLRVLQQDCSKFRRWVICTQA